MDRINYSLLIQQSLAEIITKFIQNPYNYFYEEDVRVDFAQILIRKFSLIEIEHFGAKIITSPVKCEYPSSLATKDRHDIVIVKSNNMKNIYNLDLPVIIELKLGSKSYDRCSDFKLDIKKILGYSTHIDFGIALYFYQDLVDLNNFTKWFDDIVNEFQQISTDDLSISHGCLNTFIITPNKLLLKSISYKNIY